jgi:CheY-like chemotaxis protein
VWRKNLSDKKLVLIVEDDEDIQAIYREMLEMTFELEVRQAFNGKEGVDAVNEKRPDLIVLDLLMPVMNGEEFLKELRYGMNIKDIPVIICSVNQNLAQRLHKQKDAEAVLPKLFLQKDLDALLVKFLDLQPKSS